MIVWQTPVNNIECRSKEQRALTNKLPAVANLLKVRRLFIPTIMSSFSCLATNAKNARSRAKLIYTIDAYLMVN